MNLKEIFEETDRLALKQETRGLDCHLAGKREDLEIQVKELILALMYYADPYNYEEDGSIHWNAARAALKHAGYGEKQ